MQSSEAVVFDDSAAVIEEKELVRFERADEYLSLLTQVIPPPASVNDAVSTSSQLVDQSITPDDALSRLVAILDEYQDQSNLLDPHLERIVSPPVEALQRHVRSLALPNRSSATNFLSSDSVTRLSKLVYAYTKVRGYKTIVHYFPHEVADLPATLSFLEELQNSSKSAGTDSDSSANISWELRYVCLLWLSLICMIPFDLAKFDRSNQEHQDTASRIAAVAQHFVASPGKERDAAAVVLGRLFQRSDVQMEGHFACFLSSSLTALESNQLSPFHATGILQALCETLKTSEPTFVVKHLARIQSIVDVYDASRNVSISNNSLVVKYQTKLTSRLALKLLRPRARRHANKYHVLGTDSSYMASSSMPQEEEDDEDESDVPEAIETFISYLIEALQHKDTVVRYSAAKGLARLCDRLPTSFLNQVVEAIVSLFHINIPDLYTGATDLSSVSEHTWQGACMALAELSRRGLLFGDMLSEALPWILKALLFDVRRGSHSVGANVRDAACYVVWALARSNDVESIRPHAIGLAQRLVAVATLDRDVSIRRAASAAFQESVGRLSLFPHGIDVIRLTDFYAVSVRRSAFLTCAVSVASFVEYRGYLLEHLIDVVTVHWDPAMRRLGAQSVALIAMHDPPTLLPQLTARLGKRIATADVAVLHGTLLTLAELCRASRTLPNNETVVGDNVRAQAFGLLGLVRPSIFRSLGAASLLQAACQLIGAGCSATFTVSSNDETQTWEKVLNLALARQEETVHIAAAEAISQLSTVVDLSAKIRSTLQDWSSLTLAQQQSNALLLGAISFQHHVQLLDAVIRHLISLVQPSTKARPNAMYSENIEVRRNAMDSISRAIVGLQERFAEVCSVELLHQVVRSMLVGLEDYSNDQRGDVGSWVRLSCIIGLRKILILLSRQDGGATLWLSNAEYQKAIGAMWKQAAERIDHVRHTAGTCVLAIYHAYEALETRLKPLGYEIVKATYGPNCLHPYQELSSQQQNNLTRTPNFQQVKLAFPRLCQLLLIPAYRDPILAGLITSVGSKTDLGQRIIGPALTSLTSSSSFNLHQLLCSLFELAKRNFGDNRIFVPAITTVNLVLENGATHGNIDEILLRFVKMTTTNVGRITSIARLLASATLGANLILAIDVFKTSSNPPERISDLLSILTKSVETFLTHPFPAVRVKMAEQLYTVLSSSIPLDYDEEQEEHQTIKMHAWHQIETLLLDTKWATSTNVDAETVNTIKATLSTLLS